MKTDQCHNVGQMTLSTFAIHDAIRTDRLKVRLKDYSRHVSLHGDQHCRRYFSQISSLGLISPALASTVNAFRAVRGMRNVTL